MYLCVKLHLKVDDTLEKYLLNYEKAYKDEVKRISELFNKKGYSFEYAYRYFSKSISYNSKHLVLAEAKKMYESLKSNKRFQFDYSSYWSNSSYEVTEDYLKIELGPDFHRDRLLIPIYNNRQPLERIKKGKPMNLKLIKRKKRWYAIVYVLYESTYKHHENAMGIDIGIKVPAVAATSNGKIRFFGNGREIRFVQRKYKAHILAMQKGKQFKKLNKFQHKLSHVLNDYDHKIAKQIIEFAKENDVGVIKMENLTSINQKFSIYHNPNVYLWSYRRLQEYIAYKAELNGIRIKYINPYHTSQICPQCGQINKAKDRNYVCSCGYKNHRDIVAAINILGAL